MSSPEYDRVEFHNSLIGTSPVESDGHITDGCRLDDIAKCKNVCLVNHKWYHSRSIKNNVFRPY